MGGNNMKRIFCFILCLVMLLGICAGCGATKIVICDHCGAEITIDADSNMDDSWIIFCKECEEELWGEDGMVEPG